ncbi:3-hydroxyacyl-CoA dehydrogenase family protein [Pendulispora albinea]|uniref:3-hydroxyacyl-CoA dehydrogenase family protein n=1 Tax=Pendulispora albinea TaxID=2741071 RepID=A0ABZ2LXW2_9BACT
MTAHPESHGTSPTLPAGGPPGIIAVLGSGTMGQGIAQVAVQSGYRVRLYDAAIHRAGEARTSILAQLDKLVGKGKLAPIARDRALEGLIPASDVREACAGCNVVIEAAPEDMALKVALFREALDAAPNALFGSNTSSLSLTELGAKAGAPDRIIGLHFFNPPPLMELLEVVRGIGTSDETLSHALDLARHLGKTPIVVRDSPGFATSRLGVLLGAEAIRMLETGVASAVDIDRGMELGYRHPMGPLKLTDLVGLDVRLAILEHLHKELGEQFRPPALLRTMVRAGKLGKKTGEGFYVWLDGVAHAK